MNLFATFRHPDEAIGQVTTMVDATEDRVASALAEMSAPQTITMWVDDGDMARITRLNDAECTVEVLSRGLLWAVTRNAPQEDNAFLAPLPADVAELRGAWAVRPGQILGLVSAVRIALQWISTGRVTAHVRMQRL